MVGDIAKIFCFCGQICHEIRNPLSGVINNADLLKGGLEWWSTVCNVLRGGVESLNTLRNETSIDIGQVLTRLDFLTSEFSNKAWTQLTEDLESITAIEMCTRHQKLITDDVLNLSKLRSNRIVITPVPCYPECVVSSVIRMFQAELNRKKIECSAWVVVAGEGAVKNESGEWVVPVRDEAAGAVLVEVDPDRLGQIVFNLISNAIKFTTGSSIGETLWENPGSGSNSTRSVGGDREKDRKIIITLRFVYPHLQVSVRDTGIGMTSEEKSVLFQRFSQANVKTYRDYGGYGLGLCICKQFAEVSFGFFWLLSMTGR